MRFRWYAAAFLALPSLAPAQTHSISGVVVARGSGERLAHSIVALPTLGRERFATDSGGFYFGELPPGSAVLRVRRIGYTPLDTVITIGIGGADTIRIELARVATRLSGITVTAHPPCLAPGPTQVNADPALITILNQVRLNAEQYRFLVRQYPFYYVTDVIRSSRLKSDGQTRIDSHRMSRWEASADSKYKPGRVLARRAGSFFFQIPVLVDFADPDFLGSHCFHLRGTETIEGDSLIRIDVVAAERIRDPDVNGSIYIDPATFQVRRTTLRLSKITRDVRHLLDFEVTTDFREIMPSIPIIASVSSVERIDPATEIAFDMAWEQLKLAGYEFVKRKPGDDARRPR